MLMSGTPRSLPTTDFTPFWKLGREKMIDLPATTRKWTRPASPKMNSLVEHVVRVIPDAIRGCVIALGVEVQLSAADARDEGIRIRPRRHRVQVVVDPVEPDIGGSGVARRRVDGRPCLAGT